MMKMLISSIILFIMSVLFMFNGMYMLLTNKMYIFEWLIFNFNSMKMNFILTINFKLLMFVFLVMLISSMILMYSVSYMDLSNNFLNCRFYYLMLFFLTCMIFLIMKPNILTLLLGWDGLGLI